MFTVWGVVFGLHRLHVTVKNATPRTPELSMPTLRLQDVKRANMLKNPRTHSSLKVVGRIPDSHGMRSAFRWRP